MQIVEPKSLAGFIDMLPNEQIAFNKLKLQIENSYKKFGFIPLETSVLEYSSVLLAKAGGETEKQIYRFTKGDNDVCMRFDLTVPLAKYIASKCNNITFPFKRYQIERAYRGERVQKGRFREFYQCDADIINENELSLSADAECVNMIYTTLKSIGIDNFKIKINNRKILNGFLQNYNIVNDEVLRIIDKLEKIGKEKVKQFLIELNLSEEITDKILNLISFEGSVIEVVNYLQNLDIQNETYLSGVNELKEVCSLISFYNLSENYYKISLSTVRGLDYYTGTVFETELTNFKEFGSICSGGRYENLASYYSSRKFVGVGFSIGLSRLFSQLIDNKLIDLTCCSTAKCIVLPMDSSTIKCAIDVCSYLRENNINTELYLQEKSFKNKLNYANKMGIPFVIIIGENEVKENNYCLKNMKTGNQVIVDKKELLNFFRVVYE